MPPPAIEFHEVTKVYQRRFSKERTPALSNISFEAATGEVCAFLGPNGAGKTTSISILMGFCSRILAMSGCWASSRVTCARRRRLGFCLKILRSINT